MSQAVSDEDKANELKDKGNKVLQAGDIDAAIDFYSEGINLDPSNHVLLSNRAACYLKQSSWKAALADSQKCVALAPAWGKGYVRLGSALQNLKQVEEALAVYKKGLACEGNDAGTTESLKKGLVDAQAIWNDMQAANAAKSDKNDSESTRKAAELKQLGNDALAKKDFKMAIEHYSEAINIDLDNPIIFSNRSAAYANLNMWSEAYADAQRCTFLDPKYAKGWQRKGYAAMNLKKFDEAKLAFNRGLDLEPTNGQLKQGLQEALALERNKLFGIPIPSNLSSAAPSSNPTSTPTASPVTASNTAATPTLAPKPVADAPQIDAPKKDPEPKKADATSSPKLERPEPPPKKSLDKTAPASQPDSSDPAPAPKIGDTAKPSSSPSIAKADAGKNKGKGPVDTTLYDILQVNPEASPPEIKKAYFKMAKIYHPDKSEDPQAEEMFKKVSEAYDILMDETKRKTYDQFGLDTVRQESHGELDPSVLFRMIFGGGAFDDVFGELSFVMMASQKFNEEAVKAQSEEELNEIIEKAQEQRKKLLVEALRDKLDAYIGGQDKDFKKQVEDIQSKSDSPGGPDLLSHIAYIYVQEAKKNMGRMLGIEGFFASVAEKGHTAKQMFGMVHAAVKLQQAHNDYEQKGGQVTEEEEEKMMGHGLTTIWKMGKFEIEQMVRGVCQTVLTEDKVKKKKRAEALKDLGELYKKAAKKAGKEKAGDQFDSFKSTERRGQQPSSPRGEKEKDS